MRKEGPQRYHMKDIEDEDDDVDVWTGVRVADMIDALPPCFHKTNCRDPDAVSAALADGCRQMEGRIALARLQRVPRGIRRASVLDIRDGVPLTPSASAMRQILALCGLDDVPCTVRNRGIDADGYAIGDVVPHVAVQLRENRLGAVVATVTTWD